LFVPHKILLGDDAFWVTPQRTLYWEAEKTLILADLHLGKTGHFRKSGIAVPNRVYKEDLQVLLHQVLYFKTDKLIILGDMTHSVANRELDLFVKWRKDFPMLQIHLVKGNHDILNDRWYQEADIITYEEEMQIGDFCFRHDKTKSEIDNKKKSYFTFHGHIHPAVRMKGGGRQTLLFPCFYFTPDYCILPAFSRFTGTYIIRPGKDDAVFAIVDNQIVKAK
jgi:uncharacterized protein